MRLYRDKQLVQTATRSQILDLLDARDFWVSWEDGVISFGHGKYRGTELLLVYEDTSPYGVTGVAMQGLDGYSAEWRIWEYHGTYM